MKHDKGCRWDVCWTDWDGVEWHPGSCFGIYAVLPGETEGIFVALPNIKKLIEMRREDGNEQTTEP